LHELLRLFKQTTSTPLSGYVMQTPQHKLPTVQESKMLKVHEEVTVRKSPRLQKKNSSGKAITKLAQDLLAMKWGVLEEDETLDNLTLQQYLDMYKQPLTDQSMEAILQLTDVAVQKEKKRKKK
jgi:hypothetical protein